MLAAQDKAEALPLLQKLHDAHPDDPAITRMLAEVLAEAGDAAGSDQLYVALLAASPDDPACWSPMGRIWSASSISPRPSRSSTRPPELDPANADGWSGLAFAASQHQSAIRHAARAYHAVKISSGSASTYFLWATSYDTLHQKAQAAAYYHHFLDSAAGKFPIRNGRHANVSNCSKRNRETGAMMPSTEA